MYIHLKATCIVTKPVLIPQESEVLLIYKLNVLICHHIYHIIMLTCQILIHTDRIISDLYVDLSELFFRLPWAKGSSEVLGSLSVIFDVVVVIFFFLQFILQLHTKHLWVKGNHFFTHMKLQKLQYTYLYFKQNLSLSLCLSVCLSVSLSLSLSLSLSHSLSLSLSDVPCLKKHPYEKKIFILAIYPNDIFFCLNK